MTQEVFFGTGAAKTNLSKDIRTGATRTTPEAKRRLVQIEDASPQILASFAIFHARLDSLEQLVSSIITILEELQPALEQLETIPNTLQTINDKLDQLLNP
jgi:DNA repair ATPase RecN